MTRYSNALRNGAFRSCEIALGEDMQTEVFEYFRITQRRREKVGTRLMYLKI